MTITDTRRATLGGRLRTARLIAGIEQVDLAQELGVARTTLSNWERGVNPIPADTMIRWAEITKISIVWLAYGAGVRPEGFEPPAYCSVASDIGCCDLCDVGGWKCANIWCKCHDWMDEPTALGMSGLFDATDELRWCDRCYTFGTAAHVCFDDRLVLVA